MDEEDKYWCKLERIYVHDVYESISSQYDDFLKYHHRMNDQDGETAKENEQSELMLRTKLKLKKKGRAQPRRVAHKPWPNVTNFLLQLEPHSLVADIGCGDGKYLNLNKSLMTIGCDRSSSLCNLAAVKYQPFGDRNQLAVCDNLALPFRSELFDAVISIGVIHHFSSPKRRVQAVRELARILRPGGKIMIYVWAMEQRVRKFNCQDVLVPMIDTKAAKTPQPSKFYLQRNLSNNSTAYSDESNEESETSTRSLVLDSQNAILKTRETNGAEVSASQTNLSITQNLDISTSSESVRNSDTEKPVELTPADKIEETPIAATRSPPNFISNVKQFLTKRFSSVNLKEIQKLKQENEPDGLKNQSSNSLNGCHAAYNDTMERYRQILEDHKDLLPKDFTIRKFPYSSCEDTFDAKAAEPQSSVTEKHEIKITFDLNSNLVDSPAPSPVPACEESSDQTDQCNKSNKRFYHVFKKNELDELIRDNCPGLLKVSSYNDHGNWCWVGFKTD